MKVENIFNIDLDTPIYRIFPLHRIKEIFENEELVLVTPKLWDDPFENFFLQCKLQRENGEMVSLEALNRQWYGQCWTRNRENDAMWRIYSPEKGGVRVATTVRQLSEYLWDEGDRFSKQKYFIGSVHYELKNEIEEFLAKTSFREITLGGQNDGIAKTLLTKREEFSHEQEVRILACNVDPNDFQHTRTVSESTYQIPIEPLKLINEITIDPRCSDLEFEQMKKQILALGFDGELNLSDLYRVTLPTMRIT
jgi:hypothetical protein